ncbi:MAG: hypothetical protein HFJ80_00335 [Clostridiales bacterium]|nr:hypothetical protein [Clostridiales bacterium]
MAKQRDIRVRRHSLHLVETGSPDEIPQKRRRKKRTARRVAVRLLLLLVLLGGAFLIYRSWDTLAPEALLDWADEQLGGKKGGGYPVDITGSTVVSMQGMGDRLVVTTDTALTIYNDNGGQLVSRSHGFTNPLTRVNGDYILIAEQDGVRLRLETRRGTVLELETEGRIISASVGSNGSIAVSTKSSQGYLSEVVVYNRKGERLYRRRFSDLVIATALAPDGKTFAVARISAQEGALKSILTVYHIKKTDLVAQYESEDLLLMDIAYFPGGTLLAVGDTSLWVVKPGGALDQKQTFTDSQILGYAIGRDGAGVVYRRHGSTSGGELMAVSPAGDVLFRQNFSDDFRAIAPAEDGLLLLTSDRLHRYDIKGTDTAVEIPRDGLKVAPLGKKAVVLGLSALTLY